MSLARTGRTAAAIPSGTSAEKDDDISGIRSLADNIFPRSRTHDRSDLHTLRNVIRMVYLLNIACCKTYLITV